MRITTAVSTCAIVLLCVVSACASDGSEQPPRSAAEGGGAPEAPKFDSTIETLRPKGVVPDPGFAHLLVNTGCGLKKYREVLRFILTEASFYDGLDVKTVGGTPRLKFYATKAERDAAVVDSATMSMEDLAALLALGEANAPKPPTPVAEVPLTETQSTEDLLQLLEFYNVKRGLPQRKGYYLNLDGSGTFGPDATVEWSLYPGGPAPTSGASS
jgi:hypothetical protein